MPFIFKSLLFFVLSIVLVILGFIIYAFNFNTDKLVFYKPKLSTQIFDSKNRLIANIFSNEHRLFVPFKDIPPRLIEAIVAIEDTVFFEHYGVNLDAILRAFYKVIKFQKVVEGGSTITQQLIKNVLLTSEKTLKRKLIEFFIALKVERQLSKEAILESYLNNIYLGHGYYGVKTAALGYFKKNLKDLSLKEIAILVSLPQSPSRYDPTKNLDLVLKRSSIALTRMKNLGWINDKEFSTALQEVPTIYNESLSQNKAPYFVDMIVRKLKNNLSNLKTGGYKIYTTLDLDIQKLSDGALKAGYKQALDKMIKGLKNDEPKIQHLIKNFNGAAITIKQDTGAILAVNGGVDYRQSFFNRATQSRRQVGSSIKPFLYLKSFNLGYAPSSKIIDIPRSYKYQEYLQKRLKDQNISKEDIELLEDEEKTWRPANYSKNFLGLITIRQAMVKSSNLATVNIVDKIGLNTMRQHLKKIGIQHNTKDLSLSLGNILMSPLQMSYHLTLFSNYGTKTKPYFITSIVDRFNRSINYQPVSKTIENQEQTYLILNVMQDVIKRGTGRRAKVNGLELAGKTGTTNDNRDAWFIGFSPEYQTVIWFGNDDNSPMTSKQGGGSTAAPVFALLYKAILDIKPEMQRKFKVPKNIIQATINNKKEIFTEKSPVPVKDNMNIIQENEILF